MERNKSRGCVGLLLFLSWFVYTAANVGRMDYSASMVAVIEQTGSSKNAAGLVASFFFFAYGAGQLVNGFLCHKYNTRFAVFGALILSAVMNVALPLCDSVTYMKYIWLANGAVQSVLWSSLVRLQSEYLNDGDVGQSILLMSTTTAAGTFIAYGLSALFVSFVGWQTTFYVAGGILIAAAFCWLFGVGYIRKNLPRYEVKKSELPLNEKGAASKKPVYIALAFIFVFAVANGFIKDGVTTWMPNLLKETYALETYFSIIITLILPLISISGAYISKLIHKRFPNDVLLCGAFYLVSGGVLGLALWLYTKSLAAAIVVFSLVACFMAAINNIVSSSVPFRLRTLGKSGMYAGLINTFCYAGSALSSFLMGAMAESRGWDSVLILLAAVSVAAGIAAGGLAPFWHKKISPLINEGREEKIKEEKYETV